MATYQDGNVRKATANTVTAMRRSAERRRCPECGRKSALVALDGGGTACRYNDRTLVKNTTKLCTYVQLPSYED